ncbi:MAG: ATP-dependent zinc metalloprotease FtsH [Tepidisphaeraceae bacterium]|jgi:cell division protease FtsH
MSEERPPDRPLRKNGRIPPKAGLPGGRGLFGWVLAIGLVVTLYLFWQGARHNYQSIPINPDFRTLWSSNKVQEIKIDGDDIYGQLKPTEWITIPAGGRTQFFQVSYPTGTFTGGGGTALKDLVDSGGDAKIEAVHTSDLLMNILLPLVPWLLICVFIWLFIFRQFRNSAGAGGMLGSFGKSKHKITAKDHTNITFDDVAGIEEAKEEVMEIVEFLKNPKKFQRLGGRIPRGVLLVGEPGTGKTLLAKAIAGEADCPFFSISGSDFVEMFVGVGASRVRDLFKQAKDNSPCIIFLDEIDAVGRRRGSGFSSGGHDEREQTLNAILVEMDGFDTNDQVIVCAATNRVDVLDPALTRPGRFDRQIYVPLPDVKGRLEILKVHSRKVKLGPNVDLMRLARATPGFSGADLAAIINESALGATLAGKEFIEQDDLEEARDKVRWGRARKSRVIDEKEKIATAYHEAGHAVVQYLEKDADPIHKVTIIPRGGFGGATMALPEKDRMTQSRKWCYAFMKVCFGGRIAEEMFTQDVNNGASGDIRQATGLARKMIRDWGMSDRIGFVFYGDDDQRMNMFEMSGGHDYSEETARAIDEETKRLIDSLYDETRKILSNNRDKVEALAKALMTYETLDAVDVDRVMRGEILTKPTVSDLLAQEQKRPSMTIAPSPDPNGPDLKLGGGALPAPG